MKIGEGFSLRSIAGTNIVIPVGERNITFKGMITLNNSGSFLWKHLQKETTEDELLKALSEEYEVDMATVREDLDKFIYALKNEGILE